MPQQTVKSIPIEQRREVRMSALTWKLGLAGKSHGRASTVVRLVTCRRSRDDALVGLRRHPGGQPRETSPAHVFARKSSAVELG